MDGFGQVQIQLVLGDAAVFLGVGENQPVGLHDPGVFQIEPEFLLLLRGNGLHPDEGNGKPGVGQRGAVAFEQKVPALFVQQAGVDDHEGILLEFAVGIQVVGEPILAGAPLALNEHRGVHGGIPLAGGMGGGDFLAAA